VFYSGCQKNVPIAERLFGYNTYAAILFSEHYYDKRYKRLVMDLTDKNGKIKNPGLGKRIRSSDG
jgi:hypothetical protein